MKEPNRPPSYEGETFVSFANVETVLEYTPPRIEFRADVYSAEKLPRQNGLFLEWVKRSVWLQVPMDQMWVMLDDGQVPLRIVRPVAEARERQKDE